MWPRWHYSAAEHRYVHSSARGARLDIVALLKDPAEGTQTYSCGRLLPR
jgi:hypothetical protein